MRKRIVSIFVIISMFLSYIVPLQAQENWSQQINQNTIKVGYTEVYMDSKPAQPNASVDVLITGNGIAGKEYSSILVDEGGNEITATKQTGIVKTDSMEFTLVIPGTITCGTYYIKTTIGGETLSSKLTLLNNINLNRTVSTNVTGYTGGTWDLIDGLQWAMYTPVKNKPTRENPAIFTFDYGKDIMDIYSLDLYSTYGNDQGPKTGEILYWDEEQQSWKNIFNNGGTEFQFRWDNNTACEPIRIVFDQVYKTNKIMLKIVDSYTSWENTNDIVEVQVWASKSGELPSVSLDSNYGHYGVENIIPLVIKNNDVSATVSMELVDFKSHQPLTKPVKYDANMKDGQLNYDFVVPNNVPLGSYSIHVISDNMDMYSDEYRITLDQNINIENCSKYFNVSLFDQQDQIITDITDGNIDTSWSNNGKTQLLFEVKPDNNKFADVVLKRLKIYTDDKNIQSVTLKGVAKTNYYRNVDTTENGIVNNLIENVVPNWKHDKNGDYFELDPGYLSFGNIFILELNSDDKFIINEIETDGLYLADNLLSNATISHNGKVIDAEGMTDNKVESFYKTVKGDHDEYVIDFSPRTITTNELVYTAHFPKSQGVGSLTMEIWDGNEWAVVDTFDFNHKTDNQIRESQ